MSTAYFDIETKYLFQEVGGREKPEKLGLAVAGLVVDEDAIRFYEEENVEDLFEALSRADLIVGHNLLSFDYQVLNPYASFDVLRKYSDKTLDTLREIEAKSGIRVSLDDLARHNLGRGKSGDPARMPLLWREGNFETVKRYCANDVELIRDLHLYAKQHGKLAYTHKEYGMIVGIKEVEVNW